MFSKATRGAKLALGGGTAIPDTSPPEIAHMGATTHYKGSTLSVDQYLKVGDYLMSPNRRFTGVLQRNGSFAIYWNPLGMPADWTPREFEPGACGCLYATPAFAPTGEYIMYMQSDGNLIISRGNTIQDPVWATRTNDHKTYSASIVDSGELQLTTGPGIRWRNYCAVISRYTDEYLPLISSAGAYSLSSKVGLEQRGVATAQPPSPCASVQEGHANPNIKPVDDALFWEILDWVVDPKNKVGGTVLINKKTGLALGSDGKARTRMTREVNELSTWQVASLNGEDRQTTWRLVGDKSLFLNLGGDSYREGSQVIVWPWSGGAPNEAWYT